MDWTVLVTIISGVLVYVLGQVLVKLVIDPVQEMKKTIGQIAHARLELEQFTANPGLMPRDETKDASGRFRGLASQIEQSLYLIPFYSCTKRIFGLPSEQEAREAAKYLAGLSNSLFDNITGNQYEQNAKVMSKICGSLGIHVPAR